MAIGTGTAIAIGAGALLGGIAGSQKDVASGSSRSGMNLAPESELEKYGGKLTNDSLKSLEGMVNAGPGQEAIGQANSQYESLASMLQGFSQTGGMPGQQDWLNAQEFAKSQFAPQQAQINQSFEDEQVRAKQLAAQMGRTVNDPYLQAQLSKEKMRQQTMLGANQSAFIGQEARNNAMGRLGFTSQLADLRGSLASQAMSNRQALLSLGSGAQQQERNWRMGTADKWSNQTQESGGGMKGMLTGAIGGAGMMMGGLGYLGKSGMASSQVDPFAGAVNADESWTSNWASHGFEEVPKAQPRMPQRGSRFNLQPRGRSVPY